MSENNPPEIKENDDRLDDDFDDLEECPQKPIRSVSRADADLVLLREAIYEHGRMMSEVSDRLVLQAGELALLQDRCRINARNIKVLARRMGMNQAFDAPVPLDSEDTSPGKKIP